MKRLLPLLGLALSFVLPAAQATEAGPDKVAIYIVPMEDFPEPVATALATFMAEDMKVWAKSSLRMGHLKVGKLPGTNQLVGEDILARAQPVLRSLPEASSASYFLILTTQDINSATGGFRFQFALHNKAVNTSVISMARMFDYVNGQPVMSDAAFMRLYKMMKRGIGEMHLGWKRSADRNDVMYAPLMSLRDLDSIGLQHQQGDDEALPKAPEQRPLQSY